VAAFRRVGERTVHQGYIWSVAVSEFEGPDGSRFERDIVRSLGAVGVVPLLFDPEGVASVVLVEQYRPALEREVLEIPAGMRDVEGEPPETTAMRELAEEVGLSARNLEALTVIVPSPGMSDATTHLYLATGCEAVADSRQGPEEEAMRVLHLALSEAVDLVRDGSIVDAKSVVGLLLASERLQHGDRIT
jgi:nudix-type nucleoside diphosphatase (YffH/AdpP family)